MNYSLLKREIGCKAGVCCAGRLGEEAILCKVDLATQRVGVSAVAADAMLTSGLFQWLGIALCPLHDVLSSAFVHIQPVTE